MVIYLSVVPRSPCSGYRPIVPDAVCTHGMGASAGEQIDRMGRAQAR